MASVSPKTPIAVLTRYFNSGDGKRSAKQWRDELQEFTLAERHALARDVCTVTGDILADM